MAVQARLVANLADVDLQDGDLFGPWRTLPVMGQGTEERSTSAISLKDLKLAPRVRKRMTLAQQGERPRHVRAFPLDVDRRRERTARSSEPAPGRDMSRPSRDRLSERKSFRQQGSANSIGTGPIEPTAATEEAWPPHPRAQFGPTGR